jgi:AhpD family alkylhydroperoxidase
MPIGGKQAQEKNEVQFKNQERTNVNWQEIEKANDDIKKTFGFVPSFMKNLTNQSLPGAWNEAKNLRFSQTTTLDIKLKSLIALSVSSQIPCDMINYFEQEATLAEGVAPQEQYEAVTMSAILRHWSTVLNGSQIDKNEFRKEVDKIMGNIKKMMEEMHGQAPTEEMFLVMPLSADETYKDIEKTLGLVPQFFRVFPKEGIAGAWSEFKGLQLNPHTALNGKQKELIGLAVAAQIPCDYCIYFHRAAAALNGATEIEMQEAISLAALTRHWSAIFNGPMIDPNSFKKDADKMIERFYGHNIH